MSNNQHPTVHWTNERIASEAKKYTRRTEFASGSPGAYSAAQRRGLLDKVCKHMSGPRAPKGYWTKEKLAEAARPFQTRGEFKKACAGAYRAAIRANSLNEICAHMAQSKSANLTKDNVNAKLSERGISLVSNYETALKKATFRCKLGHEWQATPNSVMRGNGCPKCRRISIEDANRRLESRGIRIKGELVSTNIKTEFCCNKGHRWITTPNAVMVGSGCPVCNHDSMRTSLNEIEQSLSKRNFKLIGEYVNASTLTEFECENGHRWITKPGHILSGTSGCPSCAQYGFNLSKPAVAYYIKVTSPKHGDLYKIGITNRDVESRYSRADNLKITIIKIWHFENGRSAREFENEILSNFSKERWCGEPVLENGNTELFASDVLNLDRL